jgi:hypothetical protein
LRECLQITKTVGWGDHAESGPETQNPAVDYGRMLGDRCAPAQVAVACRFGLKYDILNLGSGVTSQYELQQELHS